MTCDKCHGTGWYQCTTHGTPKGKVCEQCCTHGEGWFRLGEGYSDVGKWCCRAGCGTVRDEKPQGAIDDE